MNLLHYDLALCNAIWFQRSLGDVPGTDGRTRIKQLPRGGRKPVETNFGRSTPYSVGIEEEHQVIDAASFELVSRIEAILSSFQGELVEPRIKPERLQSVIEVSTKIAGTVADAVDDLIDLRERLRSAAAEHGALIASAGTHPFSRYDEQQVTERPRYTRLAQGLRWVGKRQVAFGLHIHVGVSSAEKAIACANGLRDFIPELLALSANSPFWQGRPTGLASTRTSIIESLPRSGIPPALSSMDEFDELVDRGVRTGCIPNYTYLWWDVRPHPRLGTVELRVCDSQTRIESTAALAALVQSLVATLGSAFECGEVQSAQHEFLLAENKWRAARDGLEARFIDIHTETERPAVDAVRSLVERCEPAAEALGCARELELIERILGHGNGSDVQQRIYRETESLREVAETVARETAPTMQPVGQTLPSRRAVAA
jgi:carboxylate-amine ligase